MFVGVATAQQADSFSGTWRLNVAKSRMVSPATASKSETVVYSHAKGEETFTADAVTINGEAEHIEYRAVYDGAPAPIKTTAGGKTTDGLLQLRKLDARTRLRLGVRKDGTISGIIVRRLSEDGRTITSSILVAAHVKPRKSGPRSPRAAA
ncbi:MAG: hypothetical protein ACT4QD_19940 [Acidobacteriota bacterium]